MIIGITGRAGAGKDSIADILVRERGFVKVSLADEMKRTCANWFQWGNETLWGPSERRNAPHARLGGLTARHALQQLGTEFGRACYENLWIDIALRAARKLEQGGYHYTQSGGLEYAGEVLTGFPILSGRAVVIPDVRFENEAIAIEQAGGRVIVVTREDGARLEGAAAAHVSELGWQTIALRERAWSLTNDRTLDDLKNALLLACDAGVFE